MLFLANDDVDDAPLLQIGEGVVGTRHILDARGAFILDNNNSSQ